MKLVYDVEDRPKFSKLIVFSFQQLLAIIAATIAVPAVVNGMLGYPVLDAASALVGAGFGTITYLLFTKFKSPVFLGSSFAFISPLAGAAVFGYFGILIGAVFAALVYVIIALIVKFVGTKWISKLMPAVVIGPTVALIGLSLSGSAVSSLTTASGSGMTYNLVAILCGLFTFFMVVFCSVKGNKTMKIIPFIIGILSGYALAAFFSIFGYACEVDYLKIIDFTPLINNFKNVSVQSFLNYPKFTFLATDTALDGITKLQTLDGASIATIALLYIPVSFVVFAEHIADHKNISSIIERDLLVKPGLHRTLLGDGIGSFVGAIFGGCPNTTYGESVGCVAITRNASVVSILGAAIMSILLAFISPVMAFLETIPSCVMGGVCLALYGFIAVSGLNMLRGIDLGESKNLFTVSSILVAGIGGLSLQFGLATQGKAIVTISSIATALIIGIIVNVLFGKQRENENEEGGDSLPAAYVDGTAESALKDIQDEKAFENVENVETDKADDEKISEENQKDNIIE